MFIRERVYSGNIKIKIFVRSREKALIVEKFYDSRFFCLWGWLYLDVIVVSGPEWVP